MFTSDRLRSTLEYGNKCLIDIQENGNDFDSHNSQLCLVFRAFSHRTVSAIKSREWKQPGVGWLWRRT